MALPEGATCGTCAYFPRCVRFFGCKPGNVECDWSPSRYVRKPTDAVREGGL